MSDQNTGKLNLLLAELGDTRLISSRWLRAHGYSNSLVARYVSSGWLVSPVRGVYMRKGGRFAPAVSEGLFEYFDYFEFWLYLTLP